MPIDRPDEDDASDIQPESPAAELETPLVDRDATAIESIRSTDSETDRVAYSVGYRADVAAEYAWAEAVPRFQEAWSDHVESFPDAQLSKPNVHGDGSWSADSDRKLDPEENAEVDRYCERFREIGEKVIIPGMKSVEADDTSRYLVGLEHCFKDADRLKEKVAERLQAKPGRTPAQALDMIPDAVRFTFQYEKNSYTAGVRKDIERLEARGFIQLERRGTWTSDQYKGINSRWKDAESGQCFEVQFHTQVSLEAKELTHKAYERIRSTAKDPERAELKEFQRQICRMIPVPPGATQVEDYLLEKHDG